MLSIDVSADFSQVERMFRHIPSVVEKAAVRSLNRTRDNVDVIARRLIAKDMGISVKAVRAGMYKIKATRHKLVAATEARGRPLNLIRFGAKKRNKGVSASAWGKRKIYKGTFIGNQGRTVFSRTGESRLPIEAKWGPSIPKTMLQDYIIRAMQQTAGTQWQKNIARDLKFYLNRTRF